MKSIALYRMKMNMGMKKLCKKSNQRDVSISHMKGDKGVSVQ